MFKYMSILTILAVIPIASHAAPVARQFESNALDVAAVIPGTEGMSEMEVVATLKNDINLLDEEIRTCERKRKGWVAATVAGGVGVVGTGVAALVQNSKIQDKKSELKRIESNIQETNADIKSAQETKSKLQ